MRLPVTLPPYEIGEHVSYVWRAMNDPAVDHPVDPEQGRVEHRHLDDDGYLTIGSSTLFYPPDRTVRKLPLFLRGLAQPAMFEVIVHQEPYFEDGSLQAGYRRDQASKSRLAYMWGDVERTVEPDGDSTLIVIEGSVTLNPIIPEGILKLAMGNKKPEELLVDLFTDCLDQTAVKAAEIALSDQYEIAS